MSHTKAYTYNNYCDKVLSNDVSDLFKAIENKDINKVKREISQITDKITDKITYDDHIFKHIVKTSTHEILQIIWNNFHIYKLTVKDFLVKSVKILTLKDILTESVRKHKYFNNTDEDRYQIVKLFLYYCEITYFNKSQSKYLNINSIICHALANNHNKIARLLLLKLKDVSSVLKLTVKYHQYKILKEYLQIYNISEDVINKYLKLSIRRNDIVFVKNFIENIQIKKLPINSFVKSIRHKNVEMVKLLIKHPNCNLSYCNNILLMESIYYGQYDLIKLLLKDSRIDPNKCFYLRQDSDNERRLFGIHSGLDYATDLNKYYCCPRDHNLIMTTEMTGTKQISLDNKIIPLLLSMPKINKYVSHCINLLLIKNTFVENCVFSFIPGEIIDLFIAWLLKITYLEYKIY